MCAQALLNRYLKEYFPLDSVISEEDSGSVKDALKMIKLCNNFLPNDLQFANEAEFVDCLDWNPRHPTRRWTIDPIDGTKGYLRNDQYAICIALLENNIPIFSVLGCPNLDSGKIFYAEKHKGSYEASLDSLQFTPIHCDPNSKVLCRSVETGHGDMDKVSQVSRRINFATCQMDSQCKYVMVATGRAGLYLRYSCTGTVEKIWDHAPGYLLVLEAGGTVCDENGKEIDFSSNRLISNSGVLSSSNADVLKFITKNA